MATIETAADLTFDLAEEFSGRYNTVMENGALTVRYDGERSVYIDVASLPVLGEVMYRANDSWLPASRPRSRWITPAKAFKAAVAQIARWEK